MSAPERRLLVAAVLEFERLLFHRMSCDPCLTNSPCSEFHQLVIDVQRRTAAAILLARELGVAGADVGK